MKKLILTFIIICLAASLLGCGKNQNAETQPKDSQQSSVSYENDSSEIKEIGAAEAQNLLKSTFGEKDDMTENPYSFDYTKDCEIDDVAYYAFSWSWTENGESKKLTDIFVSHDGSKIYEGVISGDTGIILNSTNFAK